MKFYIAGKLTCIVVNDGEPELMYKLADCVAPSISDLVMWIDGLVESG